jgi:hydrogenase maturation protease
MTWEAAEKVANAVLYEGYLLYPYRPSAIKNRKRCTFGEIPAGGSTGTECLVEGPAEGRLAVRLRFLQEVATSIEERDVLVEGPISGGRGDFSFAPLEGGLEWSEERQGNGLHKLSLRIENRSRETISLLSCHAMLRVEEAAFVSQTDPKADGCAHLGLWPILMEPGLVLAAPILLPDYATIAPESPRDLFDGTEIDEILSLRILTLTEAEKSEIRRGDMRARTLLERTEALSGEDLLALHGTRRPAFGAGDRVRLRPKGRADILDLALQGKEATVVAVEEDLEGRRYIAVTVEDDPGSDLGRAGFPGHRFFFRPDEVEPL